MEFIKQIMATPITWGSYITVSLVLSTIAAACYCGFIVFCMMKNKIRRRKIRRNE